jgi:hypothetical protein
MDTDFTNAKSKSFILVVHSGADLNHAEDMQEFSSVNARVNRHRLIPPARDIFLRPRGQVNPPVLLVGFMD